MGTWRSFDTDLWHQPWFEGLSHGAKLLYVFAFTNPRNSPAGFARASTRHIANALSLTEGDVRAALGELKDRLVYHESLGLLWTKGFLDHQCQNDSFLIAAGRALSRDIRDPSIIQEFLAYNTTSSGLPARYPHGWGRLLTLCGQGVTTVVTPPVPVPVPVPVPSSVLSTKSTRSTVRTTAVPSRGGKRPRAGGVAGLVDQYRSIEGITPDRRDGGVIAGLVRRYGRAHVEAVLQDADVSIAAADHPLQYLAGACRRSRQRVATLEDDKAQTMRELARFRQEGRLP